MGRRVRRVWAYRQLHGIRATLGAMWRLGIHGRQRVVVLAGRLPPDKPVDPAPDGITFRRATDDDLRALPALRAYALDGEWLHVARDGDRIVGFRRTALSYPAGSMLAAVVRPEAQRLFARETFVHPGYRHRGVGVRLTAAADTDLAQLTGAREIIHAADAANVPSLRMLLRKGARPIRFVEAFRCLRSHRYTVSPTMPPDVRRVVEEAGVERREQ